MRERVTIGFDFTSDWSRNWHKNYKPITKRSNLKSKQIRITFHSQVKSAPTLRQTITLLDICLDLLQSS